MAKKARTTKVTEGNYIGQGVTVEVRYGNTGQAPAIECEEAMQLLGWRVLSDEDTDKPDLKIKVGGETKKVVLDNNPRNRPIYKSTFMAYRASFERKQWECNGEPIIISNKGNIIDGQHTLIGFIVFCLQHQEDPSAAPAYKPKEVPLLRKVVVTGVPEFDRVIQTINTGKARSIADAIFRSEFMQEFESVAERRKIARMVEHAVRLVWKRTGFAESFSVLRNHMETIAFIENHPSLIRCVKYIYEEEADSEKRVSSIISLGYAAGLHFLASCSTSDVDSYYDSGEGGASENNLDMGREEISEEFWIGLVGGDKKFSQVRTALAALSNGEYPAGPDEISSVIIKAFNQFVKKKSIKAADLKLAYEEDEEGNRKLADIPTLGGIDLGGDSYSHDDEEEEGEDEDTVTLNRVKDPSKLEEGERVQVVPANGSAHYYATVVNVQVSKNKVTVQPEPGSPSVRKRAVPFDSLYVPEDMGEIEEEELPPVDEEYPDEDGAEEADFEEAEFEEEDDFEDE